MKLSKGKTHRDHCFTQHASLVVLSVLLYALTEPAKADGTIASAKQLEEMKRDSAYIWTLAEETGSLIACLTITAARNAQDSTEAYIKKLSPITALIDKNEELVAAEIVSWVKKYQGIAPVKTPGQTTFEMWRSAMAKLEKQTNTDLSDASFTCPPLLQ